jgi:ABC-type uncharacterized transport system involved in gliding motility auxiliary subunit
MFHRIANILGWAGVAFVFGAVALRFLQPAQMRIVQGLALAGLVCILVYIFSQWREIAASVTTRQAKYGTLSLVSIIVVVGILAGINYIASRQNKRWDLTASQEFSLSEQTRKVLQGLQRPLKLLVFAREEEFQRFRDRLGEYAYLSKQVQVEYIDADKQRPLAQKYQVQSYGTVVAEYDGRVERVTSTNEQDITNAIVKSVQGQQKKVYLVSGHGEHDPTSSDERTGYSAVTDALKRDNFTVEPLPLLQKPQVPADAAVVVIAGPANDYLQPEIDALRAYLNKGGKLLLLLDPPVGDAAKPLPNLTALAAEWGFDVGNNVVLDQSGVGQILGMGPGAPVALQYPGHPITDRFNVATAFPLARSVGPATNAPSGRNPQAIVETGAQSWAESDTAALSQRREVGFDEGSNDKRGPVTLAAALSVAAPDAPAAPPSAKPASDAEKDPKASDNGPPKPETRLVVVGDSDFVSNMAVNVQGNADLFLNMVNWLAQQENLIAIRPRQADDRRVTLTADQQTRVAWFSVALLPGAIILAGIYNWWRRRG